MKIAVCDDDKVFADEIKLCIESLSQNLSPDFEIDLYYDSQKLYDCDMPYDIAFLDIEMQPYSGIQIARRLKHTNPYIILFIITSHNKYLDDAMDLNVFRYIQKPLDTQRLKSGFEKALENIDNNLITFYMKAGNTSKSLISNDILFIETVGHSTRIVTVNGEYVSKEKMDFWVEKLIASFFYRVHKSFIVNLKYATAYQRDTITLSDKYIIPVSYRKQTEFRKYFLSYIGGR